MSNETIEDIIDEVENFSLEDYKPIDIQLFSKKNSKTYLLLSGSDSKISVKGQHKDYVYELEEDIYVLYVSVEADGYKSYDYSECEFVGLSGSNIRSRSKNDDGEFIFKVNSLIKRFTFKPDRRYGGEPEIKKVTFYGYTKSELQEVLDEIYNFDAYQSKALGVLSSIKDKVSNAENEESSCLDKIELLKEKITSITANLNLNQKEEESLKYKIETLNKIIIEHKEQESSLIAKLEKSTDLLDQKRNEHKHLNAEVAEKQANLKALKENINLFPSEIGAFVAQGAKSISHYIYLSVLPILVILIVMVTLFMNAVDLTVLHKQETDISIWVVFITRLPFVFIAAAIVHACYKLAKIFISEILKINQQRLNLSKISIIATDVSKASGEGLDLTDDELYQLRTQLKMGLLREHLKEYLNDDYRYEIPKNPIPVLMVKSEEEPNKE